MVGQDMREGIRGQKGDEMQGGVLEVFRAPRVHDEQRPSRRRSPTNRTPTPLPQVTPNILPHNLLLDQCRSRKGLHRVPVVLRSVFLRMKKSLSPFVLAPVTSIARTRAWVCRWYHTTTPLRCTAPPPLRSVRIPTPKAHR